VLAYPALSDLSVDPDDPLRTNGALNPSSSGWAWGRLLTVAAYLAGMSTG